MQCRAAALVRLGTTLDGYVGGPRRNGHERRGSLVQGGKARGDNSHSPPWCGWYRRSHTKPVLACPTVALPRGSRFRPEADLFVLVSCRETP